jgi:hypothetical protein
VTAEEIARGGTAEFEPSFAALKEAVREACSTQAAWEPRIVAGISAVIDFAVNEEEGARALTVCAAARASDETDPEGTVLAYFADRLDHAVPDEMLFPISSSDGIVETIAMVVRGQLLAGTIDSLPELGSELVYLTLMPYLGLEEARRWAATFRLTARQQ